MKSRRLISSKNLELGPLVTIFLAFEDRAIYLNSGKNFKRPKNREDSSDLDENLSESIAAPKTFIWKSFPRRSASKNMFSKIFSRHPRFE